MNRQPIFDTVRRLLGRKIAPSEVTTLDHAIDTALADKTATNSRTIGAGGIALIKRFEGCAKKRSDGMIEAYPDPGTGSDPWTIGWGATGAGIGPGTMWTQDQCDARLMADLKRYGAEVAAELGTAPTTKGQFDALVSFHYNTGAIAKATLTKHHIAGDHAGAASEFARWCYAGGRVMKGLQRRREAEAKLYRSDS